MTTVLSTSAALDGRRWCSTACFVDYPDIYYRFGTKSLINAIPSMSQNPYSAITSCARFRTTVSVRSAILWDLPNCSSGAETHVLSSPHPHQLSRVICPTVAVLTVEIHSPSLPINCFCLILRPRCDYIAADPRAATLAPSHHESGSQPPVEPPYKREIGQVVITKSISGSRRHIPSADQCYLPISADNKS